MIAVAASAALLGCSDPTEDAKRELAILQKSGASVGEICDAKKKVADAYLKQQDAYNYRMARIEAETYCLRAQRR